MGLRSLVVLATGLGFLPTLAYDQSLAHCKEVASKFLNTCAHADYTSPAASVAAMASETYTCADATSGSCPPQFWNGGVCSWPRKVCVTCREVGGVTKIRVQSNSLPNHCVNSNKPKEQNFDFEVPFNARYTHGDWAMDFTAQDPLDNEVCGLTKTKPSDIGLEENGGPRSSYRTTIGIATNGIVFQFANNIDEDPVFPITVMNEQPLDLCLGHNQMNSEEGMYHYHDVSPCINPDFIAAQSIIPGACKDHDTCKESIVEWALSGFEDNKTKTVIGIAKDGHVLYGPYDDNGDLWQTPDVDACNGAWNADKSDYFYVGTRWHPYSIACIGPANFPQKLDPPVYSDCSLNSMKYYVGLTTGDATGTCDDGLRNGNERGVDCGGPCDATCPPEPCVCGAECLIEGSGHWAEWDTGFCQPDGFTCGTTSGGCTDSTEDRDTTSTPAGSKTGGLDQEGAASLPSINLPLALALVTLHIVAAFICSSFPFF